MLDANKTDSHHFSKSNNAIDQWAFNCRISPSSSRGTLVLLFKRKLKGVKLSDAQWLTIQDFKTHFCLCPSHLWFNCHTYDRSFTLFFILVYLQHSLTTQQDLLYIQSDNYLTQMNLRLLTQCQLDSLVFHTFVRISQPALSQGL